ncbi:cytochrome c oxidase assembly factor 1 [Geosmithia morbida]|uniref:Cytochrome c oxidase assembly factor 1 n=1 Tax=Geosmithia morbida TaxID=1094350 RepID=A0A9P4YV92_9HYPO|nr:cytochrome c oxidase assembly factor 1 [Geosmithia morbida]KAF4123743.1 cytochrome c oxidase assembly factor 1 [Geosmithia morbida]
MLSRVALQQRLATPCVRARIGGRLRTTRTTGHQQKRWMTPAPKPGDGPLMSRRADRALPEVEQVNFRWGRTLPIFLAIVTVCSVAIFNYQKSSSPVIASTLYALRTDPRAREILGDDIYFNNQIPFIHGTMNQLQGRIDVWFTVRGTRSTATMRFSSRRPTAKGMFETSEWSLTTEDGKWIDLLDGGDPFRAIGGGGDGVAGDDDFVIAVDDEALVAAAAASQSTRGYRQPNTSSSK